MNTKLTLTIEQKTIQKAKIFAKEKNRSLSDIVENYLKVLTKKDQNEKNYGSIVKSLRGSFKMPAGMDYKKELENQLEKKYL